MEQTIDVLQLLDGVQAAQYTGAAATTIYLYNILLTLDLEVSQELVPSPFTHHELKRWNISGHVSPSIYLLSFT